MRVERRKPSPEAKPETLEYLKDNYREVLDSARDVQAVFKGADPKEITELIMLAKWGHNKRSRDLATSMLVGKYREAVEGQATRYVRNGTAGKGYVVSCRHARHGITPDIISAAWEGFLRALELYNPYCGVPFRPFFMNHVHHRCTREFRVIATKGLTGTESTTWRKVSKWLSAAKKKGEVLPYDVFIKGAMEASGATEAEIMFLLRATGVSAASLDDPDNLDRITLPAHQQVHSPSKAANYDKDAEIRKDVEKTFRELAKEGITSRRKVARKLVELIGDPSEEPDIEAVMEQPLFKDLYLKVFSQALLHKPGSTLTVKPY